MLTPLVQRMFGFAYKENQFMLLQITVLVWGTGQALLRNPKGRNASRDGLIKLGWVHCLHYTVNCFQYNVCDLCRCESSNRFESVSCDLTWELNLCLLIAKRTL